MKTISKTVTTHSVVIQRADLIEFLKLKGIIVPSECTVVRQVSVHVPGGGDYSNCDLLLNDYEGEESVGIDVVWTTEVSA